MKYFDLHCDTITECALRNKSLASNDLHVSLDRAAAFERWAQFFAVWIPDELRGETAAERFDEVYRVFTEQIRLNRDKISFCKSAKDLVLALEQGKRAAFLSIEGSACLCGSTDRLIDAYQKGVRMITLTWNGPCEAGDGCRVPGAGGLTPFGFELIRCMSKLGMIVDVSHLSHPGFWDVAKNIDGPFAASHSDSDFVHPHPRNLDDQQFRELVSRRGLVGLNLFPEFVTKKKNPSFEEILPHVDHFLSIGGEDVLSIGCDFDGALMPQGIRGIEDMPKLCLRIIESFGENIADKIFHKNAFDFIKRTLTE